MDINDLRGLSTALLLLAFVGLVIWAYSGRQKKPFEDAANLPFADHDMGEKTRLEAQRRD